MMTSKTHRDEVEGVAATLHISRRRERKVFQDARSPDNDRQFSFLELETDCVSFSFISLQIAPRS